MHVTFDRIHRRQREQTDHQQQQRLRQPTTGHFARIFRQNKRQISDTKKSSVGLSVCGGMRQITAPVGGAHSFNWRGGEAQKWTPCCNWALHPRCCSYIALCNLCGSSHIAPFCPASKARNFLSSNQISRHQRTVSRVIFHFTRPARTGYRHIFFLFFFSPKIWKTYESLLTQGISFIECLGFNWPVQREPKGEEKNTSALHWLWVTWTPAALDFCWSFVCNWTVALSTYQLLGLSKRAVAERFKRNVTAICGFFFFFFKKRNSCDLLSFRDVFGRFRHPLLRVIGCRRQRAPAFCRISLRMNGTG